MESEKGSARAAGFLSIGLAGSRRERLGSRSGLLVHWTSRLLP
ncbi:hypothetical protein B8V81_3530 [Paenibacillus pasadenensis]|uniref:Uncharacterized protein n=1 Tax=Paenibacillus pasadenensis TaxID=217090 RepID=A0A2N5N488_9BACL|nr:hypothetical protein B8V81_3530 [Paenibacillus pasadenensis]